MKLPNPARRHEYVLEADRDTQTPTTFVFRPLTWEEISEYEAAVPFTPEVMLKAAKIAVDATKERRELNDEEVAKITALLPDDRDFFRKITRAHAVALGYGLEKIRGLVDENNKPYTLPPEDFLSFAKPVHINELGRALLSFSSLAEADRKNSTAPRVPGRAAGTAASAQGNRRTRTTASKTSRSNG